MKSSTLRPLGTGKPCERSSNLSWNIGHRFQDRVYAPYAGAALSV